MAGLDPAIHALRFRLGIFARNVVDVEDFDLAVSHAIEDAIGVADERNDMDLWPLLHDPRALGPLADAGDNSANALLDGRNQRRIILDGVGEDLIEVGEGCFRSR